MSEIQITEQKLRFFKSFVRDAVSNGSIKLAKQHIQKSFSMMGSLELSLMVEVSKKFEKNILIKADTNILEFLMKSIMEAAAVKTKALHEGNTQASVLSFMVLKKDSEKAENMLLQNKDAEYKKEQSDIVICSDNISSSDDDEPVLPKF